MSQFLYRLFTISFFVGKSRRVVPFLRNTMIAYLAFKLDIYLKNLALFFGGRDQRAAEYPWVLNQLHLFPEGAYILDVGCTGSIFSHVLVVRGFKVFGLDLREYPFKSDHITFLRRNVTDTGLAGASFDGVVVISTIEHVGLRAYGQNVVDSDMDIRAVRELHRVLKPGGVLILTTPFVGDGPNRITSEERQYGFEGLRNLIGHFVVLKEDYFYAYRHGHLLRWIRLSRSEALESVFRDTGIACLVLRKNHS